MLLEADAGDDCCDWSAFVAAQRPPTLRKLLHLSIAIFLHLNSFFSKILFPTT